NEDCSHFGVCECITFRRDRAGSRLSVSSRDPSDEEGLSFAGLDAGHSDPIIPWRDRIGGHRLVAPRGLQPCDPLATPVPRRRKWTGKGTSPFSPGLFWGVLPRGKGHSRFAVR